MADAWHRVSAERALELLRAKKGGLTEREALARLKEHGYNELVERKKESPVSMFLRQFKNFLIIILILAAVVSAFLGEALDSAAIIAIVILNALLGFVQEYRAEKALEALKKMAAPNARVLRDGHETYVPVRMLVPGDIILLEAGDRIPADARILESYSLRADESALTGESVSVGKEDVLLKGDVFIGERKNMVFSGTTITYGRGRALVVETGMGTELGKIAKIIESAPEGQTPLQIRLDALGKQIGVIVLLISGIIFLAGVMRNLPAVQMFITGVSLAVAAIPEGLPAIVTISLALGLQRMARRNAIVRKLPAVETLGSTAVICSDKTGTLTRNEMTVRRVYTNKMIRVTGEGYEPKGEFISNKGAIDPSKDEHLKLLLRAGVLCNNARLEDGRGWRIVGDATEGTLLVLAGKAGMWQDDLKKSYPLLAELPFSSERKRMTTIHKFGKKKFAFMKGAPEVVLGLCSRAYENGKEKKLSRADKEKILKLNNEMAADALRVLAFAYRDVSNVKNITAENVERDLVFVGLVGMIDSPREEAKLAVEKCRSAGIRVIMITGDNKITGAAVAEELGVLKEGMAVLTGDELDAMSDDELERVVGNIAVYARVSPEHKVRIVRALRKKGDIIAMTGDGVNDAPALKMSDIGIAMGITGTDVSKEASDMVLTDDNFATIIAAVEEGRTIYNNIKKSVRYLLSCNVGEVLTMFIATLANLPLPLLPLQILWMNLVTDGFPALALGVDPAPPDVMRRPPRDPKEDVLGRGMLLWIFAVGAIMCIGTLALFAWELNENKGVAGAALEEKFPLLDSKTTSLDALVANNALSDAEENVLAKAGVAHISKKHDGGFEFFDEKDNLLGDDLDEILARRGRTIAFTTLIMFQMLVVFSARSSRLTLFSLGIFSNKWLVLAVLFSLALQLAVIYAEPLQPVFKTHPLNAPDWLAIILVSAGAFVILEVWKMMGARKAQRTR
ncbi:MAG: cation-translocating P-type ATPase [Candidatus Micrarchaeota archaeon]